jgi:hypothetical protein
MILGISYSIFGSIWRDQAPFGSLSYCSCHLSSAFFRTKICLSAYCRSHFAPSAPRSEGPVSMSSYFLGDPPPDPRFLASRGTLHGTAPSLTEHPGPKDLLVCYRTSWGILPQTPVFSLRSARCKSVQLHH